MTTATRKTGRRHSVRPMASARAVGTSSTARISCATLFPGGVSGGPRRWGRASRSSRRHRPVGVARDDPAPFLLMCARFLLRGVQRALQLQQGRPSNASTQGTYR
jgi:hypothetical protein